jgi:hypothetical protein
MFFRVVCITCHQDLFDRLESLCWEISGRVRWQFLEPSEKIDFQSLSQVSLVVADWSVVVEESGGAKQPPEHHYPLQNIWESIDETLKELKKAGVQPKVLHYSHSSKDRVHPSLRENPLEFDALEEAVRKWVEETSAGIARVPVEWHERDPHLKEIGFEKKQIELIVEKYFPARRGKARIDPERGGHSGVPLVRLTLPNQKIPYLLKLFRAPDDFKREWQANDEAKEWLKNFTVSLHPIPDIPAKAEAQARVFRHKGAVFFPVCYPSADDTEVLKELYRQRSDTFVRQAYQEVLKALAENQPSQDQDNWVNLRDDLPFFSPPVKEGAELPTSAYTALQDSKFQRDFLGACRELKPQGERLSGEKWQGGIDAIRNALDVPHPTWLTSRVKARFGRVHGDPNSRNLLFDGKEQTPSGLRLIDLGGFKAQAPLVADLALLEADIKFVLLATETGSGDYRDWETNHLTYWRDTEDEALQEGLGFRLPTITKTNASAARAYSIIGDIRRRAQAISPEDSAGRVYFFYLLFWSLCHIRSLSIPSTKRLFALYSAGRICQFFNEDKNWRGK